MKVWITCFIVLFGTVELLQWIQQFSLPLPVFILGGAFLAIASNYNKLTSLPFHPDYELPTPKQPVVSAGSEMPLSQQPGSQQPGSQQSLPQPIAQKPVAQTSARSRAEAVSFTISKPHQPGD